MANEEWVGRGGPREDYPRYVATTDIVSYDVYPVAGIRKSDGERYLWYVAKGVDSLRHWATDGQPVWNVIGTTRINAERGPTPAQVLRGVDVDRARIDGHTLLLPRMEPGIP